MWFVLCTMLCWFNAKEWCTFWVATSNHQPKPLFVHVNQQDLMGKQCDWLPKDPELLCPPQSVEFVCCIKFGECFCWFAQKSGRPMTCTCIVLWLISSGLPVLATKVATVLHDTAPLQFDRAFVILCVAELLFILFFLHVLCAHVMQRCRSWARACTCACADL